MREMRRDSFDPDARPWARWGWEATFGLPLGTMSGGNVAAAPARRKTRPGGCRTAINLFPPNAAMKVSPPMELLMGVRQARRLGELEAALRGDVSNREAAARLGISRRQFVRLKKRFRLLGARSLIHGNHGRPSGRRVTLEVRQQVLDLLEREVTLNDCHVRDLLEEAGVNVSADTVRRIRGELGRPAKQRRRSPRYLRRRERSAREGTMVLVDGSPHAWLGATHPILTLVGMIEDATGKILALTFRPEEDLHGYAQVLASVVREYGVPDIVYGDGTSIAVRNDPYWTMEEELAGEQAPSHFGQMLRDLETRYIRARSPEAKGRIERMWRTLQDRLTSELAMQGITEREDGEAFLPDFIARHNRRFAVARAR